MNLFYFLCSASTAQHGPAQHSTAQHSTAQHSSAQHNTAQHSTVNPHKQQSKYAPIRARQRKQADRVGSSQHVEHLYSSLYFQNERRNQNLPGLHRYYHCCCTYRFKKYPRIRKNIPVGMISFHPRKNSPPLLL